MFKPLAIAALLSIAAIPAQAQEVDPLNGTMSVTGEAVMTAPNTTAVVTFGIQSQAPVASEAVSRNSAQLQAVVDAVQAAGLPSENIETSNISLRPNYSPMRVITMYTMSNMVTLRVDDVSNLDRIMGAAANAGINQIDGVTMMPAKDAIDDDALRESAARDARHKAELYAKALGLEIVGIQSVGQGSIMRPQQGSVRMSMMKESMPVFAGEGENRASLNVTYRVRMID